MKRHCSTRIGWFVLAYEFAYQNAALQFGNRYKLGYGESLGKVIGDKSFRDEVSTLLGKQDGTVKFSHPELSVLDRYSLSNWATCI